METMTTTRKKEFFGKIFLLCGTIIIGSSLIFACAMFLFTNKAITLPILSLIGISTLAAAGIILYIALKKIFSPIKIQSIHSQKIEAVGYLAGGFSHEYNNMFAAILGAAEVLQRTCPKESREYIEIITETTKRATLLTSQLFGSVRKKKMEVISVDMHQTLHSVVEILKKNRTPNIQFHEDFRAENWNVVGNQQQIKNAFINLGINAVQSIGPKAGSVYFRTRATEFSTETNIGMFTVEAGNYFTISVEDTGESLSSDQMERIFDPYFSASENRADLGIRLASVLATVSHHNGAILAQSKENQGTTFTIYLPFAGRNFLQTTKIDLKSIRNAKANGSDSGHSLSVMVVDDDPLVRKVVTAMLHRIGYSVIIAESGVDALEIYHKRQNEIALVILDMVMPQMDGVSCFYELKKFNPNVKVLVSSGYIDNSSIEDMEKDGLCGFITKPYSYDELEKVVANAMQI